MPDVDGHGDGQRLEGPPHILEESSSTLRGDHVENSTPGCDDETNVNERDEDEEERLELEARAKEPWYRRPSSWWAVGFTLPVTIVASTTLAPRIDIYTSLACEALKMQHIITEPENSMLGWQWRKLPLPPKSCGQDPEVQAAVASLSTLIAVSQGLLTCLTAGWWGQLSDRYGRITIMKFTILGFLIIDINFFLVALAADRIPGGYRVLILGAIVSGCMGGMSSISTAVVAYMSDTTSPEKRSRNFSMGYGLIMGGMALGPGLGSYIIRQTGDLLSVFYLATASHVFLIIALALVVPESVTRAAMKKARKRHAALRQAVLSKLSGVDSSTPRQGLKTKLQVFLKLSLAPLSALALFIPHKSSDGKGRNWSMSLLALTSVLNSVVFGIYVFKFQYMQKAFGWDSDITGLWLTVVSTARALYLVILLPAVIHFFKPSSPPIQLPLSVEEPLVSSSEPLEHFPNQQVRSPSRSRTDIKIVKFDYRLALGSLCIELIAYIGTSLAISPIQWTVATMLTSFGSGFEPGMRSVALALYERGPYEGIEIGRLFGALGVADSAASAVISPALFGFIYMSTVDRFPKTMFIVASALCLCATIAMSCIRIRY